MVLFWTGQSRSGESGAPYSSAPALSHNSRPVISLLDNDNTRKGAIGHILRLDVAADRVDVPTL
jgi:hypothetical protein